MRIGVITQCYDPEKNSAIQPGIIARAIRDAGHRVQVVTGFPNYPEGRLYPGYRLRPYQQEVLDGIRVHRFPLVPNHSSNPLGRMANYLSFAISAQPGAVLTLKGADAALVYSSQPTCAMPGMALRLARGIPYVLYVQDMWPETIAASGLVGERTGALMMSMVHPYTDLVYRSAHSIAVSSPGMAEAVIARGVDPARLTFVPNWANERVFHPAPADLTLARELGLLDRPFTVMYGGNLGTVQDLESLIEAAELLRGRSDIGFALVGDGVLAGPLREKVSAAGLDNVVLTGPRPLEEMPRILALGDVQIVSLVDRPIFSMTLPSKLQSTMATGRPLIGALTGDAARVVRDSGAGQVVPPCSPQKLADAIVRAADSPGQREQWGRSARSYYEQHMSQSTGVAALCGLLQQAAEQRRR